MPFLKLDLNQSDFSRELGENAFDLVTSVEVVEHVESPIGFLRNVGRLLRPQGIAVITTPNVDNAPARGFKVTRRRYAWVFRLLAGLLPGDALMGDNHILVLQSRS